MKLVYYLRYYPTLTETFVYDEVRAIQALGHSARCVAIGARESGAQLPDWHVALPPSYPAMASAVPELARPEARWLARHQREKQVLKAIWAAQQLRADERIHAHFAGEAAEWALLAHRRSGVPYVVTVHAADLFKPRPSLREVLASAHQVLTISEANRRILRDYGVEARVVRCGVDTDVWPQASGRGVVSVARHVPKKGLDVLRRAWPQARILGPGTEAIEGEGAATRARIADALQAASLFVLPCRRAADGDRDGIPVALMEAMACGLPVITTDLPGLGELVDDAVGWTVPSDDVEALRSTIARALADPAEAWARGVRGRARVAERFSLSAQAQGVLAAHLTPRTSSLPEVRGPPT